MMDRQGHATMNRRRFLRRTAAAGSLLLLGGFGRPSGLAQSTPTLDELVLTGPPAPPSILLARMTTDERLTSRVGNVSFQTWGNPDQLRAQAAGGRFDASVMPSNVAANLYNNDVPIQLLNVNVWGILYVLTSDESVQGWETLSGQTVIVPFRGDMPDIMFRYLARQNGLDLGSDVTLRYAASPVEALQLFVAGAGGAVVLPEPAATGAEVRGQQAGRDVRRVLDLQRQWGETMGQAPRIPQAGLTATQSLIDGHPEIVDALQQSMGEAIQWVERQPQAAAELGSQYLGVDAPLIKRALPNIPLDVVPAPDARAELETFYRLLKQFSPDLIGGDLPGDGFYGSP